MEGLQTEEENGERHASVFSWSAAKGDTLKAIVGFLLTTMGSFVAAQNLATMFPNPEYAASWGNVFFALALSIFGGMLLYKSNI